MCYPIFVTAVRFPDNFLWGAATSAHQVEGNNIHSDWWAWEQAYAGKEHGPLEASGVACDSYNRYEEDFKIAKALNHNTHRLSIEWARIEPEEGKFDLDEIEHYRKVLQSVKNNGMKTFVTLWHFTLPNWLRGEKGIGNIHTPYYFARYVKLIVETLDTDIDFYVTLNEPIVYATLRHILKWWVPNINSNYFYFMDSWLGMVRMHKTAYKAIKEINPNAQVGIVENLMDIEPTSNNIFDKAICEVRKWYQYKAFLEAVKNHTDFIGINYYFHEWFGVAKFFERFSQLAFGNFGERQSDTSDWGWLIYPKGLYNVVKDISNRYKKPIYITENGLANADDSKREKFIVGHLAWLNKAISEGCDVRGYMHWSLIDNFEWAEGFKWRFGLVEVDRNNNLQRNVRPSAYSYAKICKDNMILEENLQKHGFNNI